MFAIVAPGQGAQKPGFLAPWLAVPAVADRVAWWSAVTGLDLAALGTTADADTIRDTAIAQPLLVAGALAAAAELFEAPIRGGVTAGHSVGEYAELLQARSDTLRAIRDDLHGIELTTIHRAKGREWPEVHLFGCEEHQLPHRRALDVSEEERAAGEGLEAERRLAYVAFTRARKLLVLHTVDTAASRFLTEAGLEPSRPYGSGAAKTAPAGGASNGRPRPASPRLPRQVGKGPLSEVLREAFRVGLEYALRTAPTRTVAIEAAAGAVEHRLLGRDTASGRMTVIDLLAAIELLSESERASVVQAAGLEAPDLDRPIPQVGASARKRIVRALRGRASAD